VIGVGIDFTPAHAATADAPLCFLLSGATIRMPG